MYNILFGYNAISAVMLLLLSLYLCGRYYRNVLFQVLSLFLLAGSVKIASHTMILAPEIVPAEWFVRLNCVVPLLFGPLVYLAIRTLMGKPVLWRKDVVHFMPWLLYGAYLIPWFLSNPGDRFYPVPYEIEKAVAVVITFISGVSYTVLALLTISSKEKRLKDTHSSLDRISHRWLQRLIIVQIAVWSVAIALYLVAGSGIDLGIHIDTIIFSVASIWIYTVILLRIKQPQIFVNRRVETERTPEVSQKYGDNILEDSTLESLYNDLLVAMERNQLFLTPRLSLVELAENVGCSHHDLSQVINRKTARNFHDYVNAYRLHYSKDLLSSDECELTIQQIALESGFSSKSNFNTLFKKSESLTPTQFRNSQSNR